jgi:3-deoxy-D-manno-oct-2-ulosonic acid (Kdo) hydroxylase
MSDDVLTLREAPLSAWHGQSAERELQAVIERGGVVVCPRLSFEVDDAERTLFDASLADAQRKSIYARAGRAGLTGTTVAGNAQERLGRMITRYAASAHALVDGLFPGYRAEAHATGTSFRPRAIGDLSSGKALSWRKDDTRLHVDAFPSNPTHGARILRVFTNAHPGALPRGWRVGERFEAMAERFLPQARALPPGAAWLMNKVGITKRPRSPYDQLMLQLHDLAKADLDYQRTSPQRAVDFLPGTTWICFSDQVMHAAMSGQFMFEQTYRLPLAVINDVEASPLRVLERLAGRPLL